MATTNPDPILAPLVECDRSDVVDALSRLSAAVLVYGAVRVIDPTAETRPADHPEYALAEMTPAQLVDSLVALATSIGRTNRSAGTGYRTPELLGLAEDCRDYLEAELLARLDRRPDDAF